MISRTIRSPAETSKARTVVKHFVGFFYPLSDWWRRRDTSRGQKSRRRATGNGWPHTHAASPSPRCATKMARRISGRLCMGRDGSAAQIFLPRVAIPLTNLGDGIIPEEGDKQTNPGRQGLRMRKTTARERRHKRPESGYVCFGDQAESLTWINLQTVDRNIPRHRYSEKTRPVFFIVVFFFCSPYPLSTYCLSQEATADKRPDPDAARAGRDGYGTQFDLYATIDLAHVARTTTLQQKAWASKVSTSKGDRAPKIPYSHQLIKAKEKDVMGEKARKLASREPASRFLADRRRLTSQSTHNTCTNAAQRNANKQTCQGSALAHDAMVFLFFSFLLFPSLTSRCHQSSGGTSHLQVGIHQLKEEPGSPWKLRLPPPCSHCPSVSLFGFK